MLEGVTFSGGEPMQQAEALLNLTDLRSAKRRFHGSSAFSPDTRKRKLVVGTST